MCIQVYTLFGALVSFSNKATVSALSWLCVGSGELADDSNNGNFQKTSVLGVESCPDVSINSSQFLQDSLLSQGLYFGKSWSRRSKSNLLVDGQTNEALSSTFGQP